eukprot:5440685-Amphidinium_carterae.1
MALISLDAVSVSGTTAYSVSPDSVLIPKDAAATARPSPTQAGRRGQVSRSFLNIFIETQSVALYRCHCHQSGICYGASQTSSKDVDTIFELLTIQTRFALTAIP